MTATVITADERQLDLGWVVRGVLGVLRRRAPELTLVGLPFVVLPNTLVAFIPNAPYAVQLVAGLPGLVFIGGGSLIAYRDLTGGQRVTAGEAIRVGAQRFGSVWGVSVISNLGILLGLLLLIVPGFILAAGWMPAVPITVVEGKGAYASVDRAWNLTKGSRWRLAGLLGIGAVAAVLTLLLLIVPVILLTLVIGQAAATAATDFVLTPIWVLLLQAILTVGSAAAYVGLRKAKEGLAEDISAVFA